MTESSEAGTTRYATFGGGCFWCVEAVFQRLAGVLAVESGYEGGHVDNPTYRQICNGDTGHAEVVRITYDPSRVEYAKLLEVFFKTHDPTTLNRQGNDRGTQYRSVVFFHDDEQKAQAETAIQRLTEAGVFDDPIVTEVTPTAVFYKAEDYHQNYYNDNPRQGYCQAIIAPKLDKFEQAFAGDLQ
ncbi:MAG: peptide-methionine (S)-S-oxide reductase MsrA [Planctomycetota bacterium]|nr:peptide-methionine (S)-S-oxide reductase MsrA [Planctomycetota bacterium]